MRKTSMFLAAAVAAAGVALAASYSAISFPTPGVFSPVGIGVAKVAAIQVEGAYPDDGTVIISRISKDSSVTNALLTRTCASGAYTGDIGTGTNIYLFAGDRLMRSGTATNACSVLLILNE